MVTVKCDGIKDSILLQDLVPFQGDLKKRTDDDVAALQQSIESEGLLMPFVVWRKDKQNFLLDGHGRLQALSKMQGTDKQKFPVLFVEADTEAEARKALLQITSSYGKVTKKGAVQFTVSIPGYKAPAVNKLLYKPVRMRKVEQKPAAPSIQEGDYIMRIALPVDKVELFKELLGQVSYVKVL